MFYVLENSRVTQDRAINIDPNLVNNIPANASNEVDTADYSGDDVDIVDDALLNTSPHNRIERQLLTGDVVGLAMMSGAIIWSAMSAFG